MFIAVNIDGSTLKNDVPKTEVRQHTRFLIDANCTGYVTQRQIEMFSVKLYFRWAVFLLDPPSSLYKG